MLLSTKQVVELHNDEIKKFLERHTHLWNQVSQCQRAFERLQRHVKEGTHPISVRDGFSLIIPTHLTNNTLLQTLQNQVKDETKQYRDRVTKILRSAQQEKLNQASITFEKYKKAAPPFIIETYGKELEIEHLGFDDTTISSEQLNQIISQKQNAGKIMDVTLHLVSTLLRHIDNEIVTLESKLQLRALLQTNAERKRKQMKAVATMKELELPLPEKVEQLVNRTVQRVLGKQTKNQIGKENSNRLNNPVHQNSKSQSRKRTVAKNSNNFQKKKPKDRNGNRSPLPTLNKSNKRPTAEPIRPSKRPRSN